MYSDIVVTSKGQVVGRKRVLTYRSRNATWASGEADKREKKEKKLRDVTSHIFAQTTHIALPHQICHV